MVNSKKKKNINMINIFYNLYNLKTTYCLISIKKYFNYLFFGIFKTVNGYIFCNKLINGCFLGNFFKNINISLKFFKNNFLGVCCSICYLPIYSIFSNLYLLKWKYQVATSNGTYCQLLEIKQNLNLVLVKFPSGFKQYIFSTKFCLIGRNSNIFHKYIIFGKASFNKNLGRKSNVRGVAKNPVDHPHGGRTKTCKPEVSPWGWVTKNSH